jgi:N-formylmaleamate deformylase
MADWRSGEISVGGLNLHYSRTGGDKPPLVLAHGFSDDGLRWTPVAEALAPHYDVIMPDARGHGKSDGPEAGYDPLTLAEDLHGVITGLGLHRPALLGHSMGGATALLLAALYPAVPGAILVEDPGGLRFGPPPDSAGDQERAARGRGWVTGLKRRTREELIARQREETPHWSDAEFGPWADAKLRLSFNVLNYRTPVPIDWDALLPRITCPALLITADPARGAIVTPEMARELQQRIPHLRIASIPNAGHSIRRDRFEEYMRAVREFLANPG